MARETIRIEGLAGVLDLLKQLPPEIVSKSGGPVKLALRDAANVLRDEARRNVNRIVTEPNVDGLPTDSTGLLEKNIVSGRSKPASGVKGERFAVRIRRKPYAVASGQKPVSTPQVGRLLEYGTEKMQPHAWLRPAFDSKKAEAVRVFVDGVNKRTAAVVKRLERLARRKG